MQINDVYNAVLDVLNKKLSGGVSPQEFNEFAALANADLFKYYTARTEGNQANQATPQNLESTFAVSDILQPFILITDITRDTDGTFHKPTNYETMDYMLYGYIESHCDSTVRWRRIEQVTGGERAIRLDSALIPPTFKYPISAFINTGWLIDPEQIMSIRLCYLRMPVTPVWGFTVTNDQPIFDATASVNPEWNDTIFGDFVARICRYAGINLDEPEVVNEVLQRIAQGT